MHRAKSAVGWLLLAGLAGVVVWAATWRPMAPRADFTYAIGDSIKTLDPAKMSWNEDIRMALGVWEGLTSYDPVTLTPIPAAAVSWQISGDGLTYVFDIRPEARWSNGDPVRASDFVYGWRRAIEPGTAEDYAFLVADHIAGMADYAAWRNRAVRVLSLLRTWSQGETPAEADRAFLTQMGFDAARLSPEAAPAAADRFREAHRAEMEQRFAEVGVRALDDKRLEVTLARPTGYFLELTAFSTFLPIHPSVEILRLRDDPVAEALTLWVYDPQWVKPDYHVRGYPGLVSNGPFRLAAWQFKRFMRFERNPYYWDRDQVRSASIEAHIMPEPTTAFLAYERGAIDWLDDVTRLDFAPALWDQAQAGHRDDIHHTLAFGTYFYLFNCRETLPDGTANPVADPRVRQALNLAVDKRAIAEQVRDLGNPPARHLIPPGSIAGYACPPGPDFDPERARALLAEAGWLDRRPRVEIVYNSGYGHEIPAQAIAEMWRQHLELDVSIQGKELKSFVDDRQQGRFTVCRSSWYGDYGDPTTFLDLFVTDNGNNHGRFSDPHYDALMRRAAAERDPQRRLALLAEAETLLLETAVPLLPVYHYVNLLAFRPQVRGLHPNARNLYLFKHLGVADKR